MHVFKTICASECYVSKYQKKCMAATKTKSVKASLDGKSKIIESYIDHVLTHDKTPTSVYSFCKAIKIDEADFYTVAQSLVGIEALIWEDYVAATISKLETDDTFSAYSVREKALAFYFTFFEDLKKNRSFVSYSFEKIKETNLRPTSLHKFKELSLDFSRKLLYEAISNEEIVERKFISDKYVDAFWFQMLFLIRFWLKDSSTDYEKTDAAIEKSVNLAFDLAAKSPLDGILDFAKFLYQNK